jgi:hypothetical protein
MLSITYTFFPNEKRVLSQAPVALPDRGDSATLAGSMKQDTPHATDDTRSKRSTRSTTVCNAIRNP